MNLLTKIFAHCWNQTARARGRQRLLKGLRIIAIASLCLLSRNANAAAGDVDITFNPAAGVTQAPGPFGIELNVLDLAVQPDGKTVIVGRFSHLDDVEGSVILRLNSDGSIDSSFATPVSEFLSSASLVALQPDGKIIIARGFSSLNGVARPGFARLNSDGSLDPSFNPGAGPNRPIDRLAVQADGKILIIGKFTQYAGVNRNLMARINSDGSLDTTFNLGTLTETRTLSQMPVLDTLAIQPDGRILIGGIFERYNGAARTNVARINADGSLDSSFVPETISNNDGAALVPDVTALLIQPDGKILIGGRFTHYGLTSRTHLARLNSNGALDTTFNPGTGPNADSFKMARQTDGKIVIGGFFLTQYNGVTHKGVVRVNVNGSLDNTFDSSTDSVNSFAILSDGKILVGGGFTQFNAGGRNGIARANTDGSLDTSFNLAAPVGSAVRAVALQLDGKILIAGFFTHYNGVGRTNIARLNSDGSLDASFNPGAGTSGDLFIFGGLINTIAIQADGKILIGGWFTTYAGVARNRLARLNPDGSLDTTFDPGAGTNSEVRAFAIQADGKILVGGAFGQFNGVARAGMARLNANGSLDTSFDPGAGSDVVGTSAIIFQSDGKILAGGQNLVRLNPDGSRDTSFTKGVEQTNPDFDPQVNDLVIQPDGKIVIGGRFDRYSGVSRNNIARVNTDGTLDLSFNPGAGTSGPRYPSGGAVRALVIQPDGKVVIGGYFDQYNGVSRNHIARLSCDGSLDLTFNSGMGTDRWVEALVLQADNRLLLGGLFNHYNGTARNNIARALTDAVAPSVQFSATTFTVQEDCTTVALTVTRTGGDCTAASVDYATANLTATDRGDFIPSRGRLTFAAGETAKSVVVLINEDSYVEGDETFRVNLSNPSNTALGASTATITIIDDATEPATNPIDDPQNFVCQQYHDFLNRQPDAAGLAFWTGDITSCGNNQACISEKRTKVSSEFFLSIEFQNTGYLAERIYRVGFGSPSGTSTLGGIHTLAVPTMSFDEFLSDARGLGNGVVVNQTGWETLLDNNKQSFILNFVQRGTFVSAYPTSLTPTQFVEALFAKAGVSPNTSERSSIIGEFGTAANTLDINARARAVRRVAENSTLAQQELTRAFVLIEYFGYLRRNPNDPQDTDYTGYDFWLTKLNQSNGNYVSAEMVKAFLTSIEYRRRFGP